MKKKITVQKINDSDTEVEINSPEHRIEEIKREIQECFVEDRSLAQAQVLDMWND